jgi:hypothetical protein
VILRRRFGEVVSRQLDLFEREEADLLRGCRAAERAYQEAEREDAEERYGDYLELVESAAERLAELRDAYAARLEPEAAAGYEAAFNRAAAKRFRQLPLGIAED